MFKEYIKTHQIYFNIGANYEFFIYEDKIFQEPSD